MSRGQMHVVAIQAVIWQAPQCLLRKSVSLVDTVLFVMRQQAVVCCWGKIQTALSEVKPFRCMQGISIEDRRQLKVAAYLGALLEEVCMKGGLCLAAAQLLPDSGPMAAHSC